MQIIRLALSLYKRLMLSDVNYIEWTPKSKMMLLLGRNGSGKSSILEELTPCPARHTPQNPAFAPGGRKEIDLIHKGLTYQLKSVYDGGTGRHSFIENGVELNEGGTLKIFTELVFSRFGLTREIHEVLVGITTFTEMPTSKRREWLTRLSPIDLTYAFEKHKEFTTYQRDALGVIRHLVKRMNNENFDLPDDSEVSRLNGEVELLQDRLDKLYQKRLRIDPTHNPNFDGEHILKDILRRSKSILRQYPVLPDSECVDGYAGYMQILSDRQNDARFLGDQISKMVEEVETLRSRQPLPDEQLSPEAVAQLVTEKTRLTASIQQLETKLNNYTGVFELVRFDVHGDATSMLDALQSTWIELIQQFPMNEDGAFNPQAGQQAKEHAQQLKNAVRYTEDRHVQCARRLATLRGCVDVTCPSCDHQFKPGVDLNEVTRLEAEVVELQTKTQQLEEQLQKVEEFIQKYEEYTVYVYRFRQMVQTFPQFQPVWDYCAVNKVMFREPRKYLTPAIHWIQIQREYALMSDHQHQLKVIEQKLELAQRIDRDAVGYLVERTEQLEHGVSVKERELQMLQRRNAQFREAGTQIQQHEKQLSELVEEFLQFARDAKAHVEYLEQRGYEEETKAIHLQLSGVQRNLEDIRSRERILKELEHEHGQATEWHADMGLIAKALSPKDGLIGRYLMGFMQEMVKLMNAVIEEMWTYPLEILPSKVDKDELDYNFPLSVDGGKVIAPDISRGSSSQRDIINFAFKLMVMKFMGFENYPLQLDEFGSTFDEQHRENLIPFMNRLMELEQISQVFYISHFSATHGAFGQAETFVLDPNNITVPRTYNQNVVIA